MNYEYIIATSDWHLTRKRPVSRIDKMYFEHGLAKVLQIVNLSNEYKAPIIIGGDIYDSLDVTPYMINTLIDSFAICEQPVYAVAGQHDMDHRQLIRTCPYMTLVKAESIEHLTHRP